MMIGKRSREPVDAIEVSDRMRDRCDDDTVVRLMDSIQRIGLQTPISVRWVGDNLMLVAGRHRLEAVRRLGWENVDCTMLTGTDDEARMWEIAENLHRADLTVLERDEHISEWVRLAGKNDDGVSAQDAPKLSARGRNGEGRPESGINAASRELGVERTAAQRATKVAAITPEAKAAAKENGLDNNQAALLQVAKAPPEEQAAKVEEIAAAKKAAADAKKAERLLAEEAAKEAKKANAATDTVIRLTVEQQYAEWIMRHVAISELDTLIAWIQTAKPAGIIAALRRNAA
jgi:ParB-like chromosome segregation protein Spo0J